MSGYYPDTYYHPGIYIARNGEFVGLYGIDLNKNLDLLAPIINEPYGRKSIIRRKTDEKLLEWRRDTWNEWHCNEAYPIPLKYDIFNASHLLYLDKQLGYGCAETMTRIDNGEPPVGNPPLIDATMQATP